MDDQYSIFVMWHYVGSRSLFKSYIIDEHLMGGNFKKRY